MQKTQAALDDLFSTFISLVPTWLNMLKSTRFLTVLIILAVLVWAWKYSGLTDVQAQIVSIVGGLLGVNFDWVKTIGKKYETPSIAIGDAARQSPAESIPQPKEPVPLPNQYEAPIAIDDYIKNLGGGLYDLYTAAQRVISSYNLLKIHPTVRVTVAEQVVDKAIMLAKQAWPTLVGVNSSGAPFYRAPESSDYTDYASKQTYDKAVRDAIPGCQYMPEGAYVMFRDMEDLYRFRANLTLLEGKPIRWYEPDGKTQRIKYIYTLSDMGLSAVA
jgi:hypothetical protein